MEKESTKRRHTGGKERYKNIWRRDKYGKKTRRELDIERGLKVEETRWGRKVDGEGAR